MEHKNTIVIVDDHPLFLEGVKSVIIKEKNLSVIGESNTVEEAVEIINQLKPDIALLDVEIKNKSGFDVVDFIKTKQINTKIIFLTMYNDIDILNKALKMGVNGFILKEHTSSEIVGCIKSVMEGKSYISPLLSDNMMKIVKHNRVRNESDAWLNKLTISEKRILKLISEDKTSREIANELNISSKTVENHRNNISEKLNLHSSHSLVKFAIRNKEFF